MIVGRFLLRELLDMLDRSHIGPPGTCPNRVQLIWQVSHAGQAGARSLVRLAE